ncbi:LON peptidase substrate-binding domain-containing protein [Gimesia algae]|uniref:DNA-binding ATP-dependent protease La n=1 Tax=Gimesia algae TaxID=2527971 RepID=A0A517VLA6_9PLAN|nr:LON peptidase substrate-binding domain-containing protein [Gimesia algae]QDT93787.1 DNA-binding ATP-dependent protease La [Gimesia algae]
MLTDNAVIEQQLKTVTGMVPVLKLEDCVLLPHAVIPLRLTDPADCQLIDDALNAHGFIAVDLKQTCPATGTELSPESKIRTVCVASVQAPYQLQSGARSILLQGLCRAQMVVLQNSTLPYQKALLDLKTDYYADQPVIHRDHRQLELLELYSRIYMDHASNPMYYHQLHCEVSLGTLCDTLAGTIRLEPALSQMLLNERDVDLRSDLLLSFLKNRHRERQQNPVACVLSTDFSCN